MFFYLIKIWILSNLVHPLCFLAWLFVIDITSANMIGLYLVAPLLVFSLVCSLPMLLLCFPALYYVLRMSYTETARFALWIAVLVGLVLLSSGVAMVLYNAVEPDTILLFVPAILSVILVSLLTYRSFHNLLLALEK